METGSLERSFRQIRNDLSSTAHRLDITFDDAIEGGSSTHPLKLMRRVQALEELTKSVAAEWKEIEARRQELIPKVVNDLIKNSKQVTRLGQLTGCNGPVYVETSSACVAQLMQFTNEENLKPRGDNSFLLEHQSQQHQNVNHLKEDGSSRNSNVAEGVETLEAQLSQELFEALPPSTRGRVKYETVSKAYAAMDELFTEYNHKNVRGAPTEAVPLKDLHTKGVKVHGRSGDIVLQCLRKLRLITLNKQGVILTKPVPQQAAPKRGKSRTARR